MYDVRIYEAIKWYEADLLAAGIPKERIYKLGFAFQGKDVWVMQAGK